MKEVLFVFVDEIFVLKDEEYVGFKVERWKFIDYLGRFNFFKEEVKEIDEWLILFEFVFK